MNNVYSGYCLAHIRNDPRKIIEYLNHLKAIQISNLIDRQIFQSLFEYYDEKNEKFSPLFKRQLTQSHLERLKEIIKIEVPFDGDILRIVKGIKEEFRRSMLNKVAQYIIKSNQDNIDPDEVISRAKEILDQATIVDEKPFKHIRETQLEFVETIEQRIKGITDRVSTGSECLDFLLLGGFKIGDLVVLASMTGQGKTFFMVQILMKLVLSGKKIAILGLEMNDSEYNERLVVRLAQEYGLNDINMSNLADPNKYGIGNDFEIVMEKVFSSFDIVYLQPKMINIDELKTYCNIAVNEHGVDAIFLDHTLLIDSDNLAQHEMISEIVKFFKNFATDNKIISFVVSQMNRETDLSNMKVSNLSGGRGIEHMASVIMAIGKHDEDQISSDEYISQPQTFSASITNKRKIEDRFIRRIEILKARGAPSGSYVKVKFLGDRASFIEIKPDNWNEIKNGNPNSSKFKY